jgi:hypothetical protein
MLQFPSLCWLLTYPRIAEGQFYEAQQQTRVVAARYVKQENWEAAVDILFNVAQSLLKAGQGGSGGDLGIFLIDVYKQAALKPDSSNKGRLLTLLRQFDSEEPTRKKFISEMIMYVRFLRMAFKTDNWQMVCKVRRVPRWRTRLAPCCGIFIRRGA